MKIIFLGDSITEGAGASKPENTFVSIVGKTLGVECLNYGIGGTRFARQRELHCECVQFNYDFNMRFEICLKRIYLSVWAELMILAMAQLH